MPTIENFCKDCHRVNSCHESIRTGKFFIDNLEATRPFLTQDRINRVNGSAKRRRSSVNIPELIIGRGRNFILDGHHKVRVAYDNGEYEMDCRFRLCQNPLMLKKPGRRLFGHISSLPILDRSK
jgi:hypothetical protein